MPVRGWIIVAAAATTLVAATTPAQANAEFVDAIPGPVCGLVDGTLCSAQTTVYLQTPAQFAACMALLTAGHTQCDGAAFDGQASLLVNLQWYPGGCATQVNEQSSYQGVSALWAIGGSSDLSGPATCTSLDFAQRRTFSLAKCPGTQFTVTAEVRGNADGTYTSTYAVDGAGPCAGAFVVLAVEGALT